MSRFTSLLCVLFAFLAVTSAMYSSDSKVVKLTAANFREKVINSNELWFVEFYAPWCGHCKKLAPDWEKLATALKGMINVGAVDMTTDQAAGQPYGIRGYPTLKFFGANKNAPEDYQGSRSVSDMINYAFDQAKSAANARVGVKGGSSNSGFNANAGNQGGCGAGGQAGGSAGGNSNDKDVIVLTDSNFDELLMKSDDLWIVDFYAPWCGHCKRLEPEWNQAATDLKGEVKIAKVDATKETALASRFGINSFPQIRLFPTGPKSDRNTEDYSGARDAASIVSWAQEKKVQYKPVLKAEQLIDQETFDKYCTNLRGICFISFLPHIYDSSAEERNKYIDILQELSKSNRANPVTFLWAQGGDYYDLEEKLGLAAGYPSFVALAVNKMKYAPLTGAFDKKNIDTFVKSLISGKHPVFDLKDVPRVKPVTKWDGKSSKPTQYEGVDL